MLLGLLVTALQFPGALKRQREIAQYELKLSLSPSMDSNMASFSEMSQPLLDD
jgi:hypothetical protein